MEIHGGNTLPVIPVNIRPVDLILKAGLIRLIAHLAIVAIDGPEHAGAREPTVIH